MCNANPTLPGSNGPVDVSAACPVLAAWDLHDNLDSNGALLFRRFASRALAAVGLERPPGIFDEEYTPGGDPVNTPRGLNTDEPASSSRRWPTRSPTCAARASRSTRRCAATSSSAAAPSRSRSTAGPGTVGVFNAINVGWVVQGQGYPNVPHGSSYVYTTQFTDGVPGDTRRSSPTRCPPTRTRPGSPTRPACSPTSSGSTRPSARTRSRPTRTSR